MSYVMLRLAASKNSKYFSKNTGALTSLPKHRLYSNLKIPPWASFNPSTAGIESSPYKVSNLVHGNWTIQNDNRLEIPDPLNKNNFPIFTIPDTKLDGLTTFINSMENVPKSGLHNPLKNVHRYLELGEISRLAGEELKKKEVAEFFARSIMKCVPKSHAQALGEVRVTASFLSNFSSDNVRFLSRSFGVPGDHDGQQSNGYRWPFGAVCIIAPFNFPLEIPVLQLMGALFMGNKPVLKPAEKASVVIEQFLHLLHHCGMKKDDVDFLNCRGQVAGHLVNHAPIRMIQFTGSSQVAELLSEQTHGKVKIEDAGFNWKILGPDVSNVDYVAWQCDEDAYASSGQKCSAQSILFMHENWAESDLINKIKLNAEKRNLEDLTIGPTLTVTTETILSHTERVLEIPGSYLICGGKELSEHNIHNEYGAVEPTAVFVPLKMLLDDKHYDTCTKEIFGPFQIVSQYNDDTMDLLLQACEGMSHNLTAAVVSNDTLFLKHILAHTVNGTTYAGVRARTTGAPQNHWFGPAGDPRGAGIGSPEAIKAVWSSHREIITDSHIPIDWSQPMRT